MVENAAAALNDRMCSIVVKVRFVAKFSDNGTLQAKQDSFQLARDSGVKLSKSSVRQADYSAK